MSQKANNSAPSAPEVTPSAPATDQTAPAAAEPATETQQVEILRSHPAYGYWPGQQPALAAEHVAVLVEGSYAKLVEAPIPPTE